MNTAKTKLLVETNNVVTLKADKSGEAPEVDHLLRELGNPAGALPFYAIYPPGSKQPIILRALITQDQVIEALEQAGPSKMEPATAATVMK